MAASCWRQTSELRLINADSGIDDVAARTIDGRTVEVFAGKYTPGPRPKFRLDEAGLVLRTQADRWSSYGQNLSISLRDRSADLDRPVQPLRFSGTGGSEGGSSLKDRAKPLVLGRFFGAEPVYLAEDVWQISSGKINAITTVRFAGNPLTGSVVEASGGYDKLAATTAPAGGYAFTRHSTGSYIKLGSAPIGLVTIDGKGETLDETIGYKRPWTEDDVSRLWAGLRPWAEPVAGPGYVETVAGITRLVLTKALSWGLDELSLASFTSLDRDQPAPMGAVIPMGSTMTVEQFLGQFLGTAGCYLDIGRLGEARIGQIGAPAPTAALRLTELQIIRVDRDRLPYEIPAYEAVVEYRRNGVAISSSDIAEVVPLEDRAALEAEALSSLASDIDVQVAHRRSKSRTIAAYFAEEADAAAEAARQLAIYDETRRRFQVSMPFVSELYELGQTVEIVHRKHGLSAGQNFVITRVETDFGRGRTILELFG